MNEQRHWRLLIPERVRGSVRALAPRRYLLSISAVVVAVAMGFTLAPRALSDAASTTDAAPAATASPNDDGVTWSPLGTAGQNNDGNGDCVVSSGGTVTGSDSTIITQVAGALNDESPDSVGQDDIGDLTVSAPVGESGSTSMTVYADGEVDCSLINQTDAYIKKSGYGSLDHFAHAVLDARLHPAPAGTRLQAEQHAVLLAYDAVPAWLKGAIGAIAGAVVYVAVSVVTVATMVALGAATTASGGLTSPVLAAFAGCIGGAISTAVTLGIAGASSSPLSVVTSGVAGCLTGGLIANIPAATTGAWLGSTFRSSIGLEAAPVVGNAIVADAAAGGADLSPIAQAMQDALNALASP